MAAEPAPKREDPSARDDLHPAVLDAIVRAVSTVRDACPEVRGYRLVRRKKRVDLQLFLDE